MASIEVLVTGATGKQGGAVARALIAGGHRVRALTRNPSSPSASALAALGAEVVAGNFDKPETIARALDGVDSLFAMGTFFESGVESEITQGLALVEAAARAKIGHVVYTSVAGADQKTQIPHFESKGRVEEALKGSGLPWTILAPVYFMENLYFPQSVSAIRAGTYPSPLSPRRTLQQVAVADIGSMGRVAIERKLIGRRIELAGDDIDSEAVARALSRALGRPIALQSFPLDALKAQSHEMWIMYKYFEEVGYQANISALRREFPEVGWHRFDDWLAKQDLSSLR